MYELKIKHKICCFVKFQCSRFPSENSTTCGNEICSPINSIMMMMRRDSMIVQYKHY
jgi:hypothetical protein